MWSKAAIVAASGLALAAPTFVAAPAYAQQEGEAETQYVPREEYEQLKQQVEQLQGQVEDQDQSREQLREDVMEQARQDGAGNGLNLFPDHEWTPGWEDHDNAMQPGREDEMNLMLGRSGPMDFYIGLDTVGRLQYFEEDNVRVGGTAQPGLEPNFQTAFGNLEFLATLNDQRGEKKPYMEVYFDLFLASRPHPDALQGDQGYMLLRRLPEGYNIGILDGFFDVFDVKAGEFELDFGDHRYRRSNNANVQRNPLIGNYVVDPRTTEVGMEVMTDPTNEPGVPNFLVGLTSGEPEPNLTDGDHLALHGKAWMNLTEELRIAGSTYYVDQSEDGPGFPIGGSSSNMFASSRDGGPYGAILGGGNAPGQVFPGGGQKVLAFQGDLTWSDGPLELYGNFGWATDEDVNGSVAGTPEDTWYYGAAEGVYNFTPKLYAAARYSAAFADKQANGANTVESDGWVDRIQVGGGYWATDTILVKAEYVYQKYHDFDQAGGQVSGVDAWLGPEFNGVISEVSFAF